MQVDLTRLGRSTDRLREGLAVAAADPGNEILRDGVIQRFEYTYELSHKTLRRFLEATEPSQEIVQTLSFPNLIRLASERTLLRGDWESWHEYREARGTTSHAYDGEKAAAVFAKIPSFLAEAEFLLAAMTKALA